MWIYLPRGKLGRYSHTLPCVSAWGINYPPSELLCANNFQYHQLLARPRPRQGISAQNPIQGYYELVAQSLARAIFEMASLTPTWRAGTSHPLRQAIARPLILQSTRHYASLPGRGKITREMERASRQSSKKMAKEQSMSNLQKIANAEYFKDGGGPLFPGSYHERLNPIAFPLLRNLLCLEQYKWMKANTSCSLGTFVSLPLSQYPKSPSEFFQYQVSRMKHWLICATSVLNFKLKSMPNWTTRPKWKARRGKIGPTAKAMYREMLEAFAAGDKITLNKICLGEFAKKLCAAIDRRDPKERVLFEVVKYNKGLFYPKLMSHQIHEVNPFDKTLMTEQAVVAISSTQQASKVSAITGETIPGSLKLQDKMEYVVLSRQANQKTFETTPWRIWGTTSATTMEAYLQEKAVIDKEQAKRAGWSDSSSK